MKGAKIKSCLNAAGRPKRPRMSNQEAAALGLKGLAEHKKNLIKKKNEKY